MPLEVSDVISRLGVLKKIRQPYESLWKDITKFVLPRRSFWDLDSTKGLKPPEPIYDGTAIAELQLLVDGTLGNLVSPNLRWLRLTMEDKQQNEIPYVRDWLEEVENVIYAELARSNYYAAMSEFFLDGASVGTAIMLVDEDMSRKKMLFSTRHMKECYIAEARDGSVDTLYREFKMTNRQMAQVWGDDLCDGRKNRAKDAPFGDATVIHAVFPRAERDAGKFDSMNKKFASVYIDKEFHSANKGKFEFLGESGYDEFPYLVWRWRKNSDEIYGRSPASDAIQDVIRLNQIGKSSLTAAQLAAEPPLNVPMTSRGMERIVPRGFNYFTNPLEQISAINLAGNFPISKDQEAEIKDSIRNIFRTKMYLLMESLEGGPYTATEINARQGEKTTVQGPMIGRLNSETLIPVIKMTYMTSEKNGLIPDPPPGLEQGGRIHIDFQGPLALQTKKYHQQQGIDNGMLFLREMSQMFPNSMINVDEDELIRQGMDAKGLPQKIIREMPEVEKIKAMMLKQQQEEKEAAMAAQQQEMLAKNAGGLNEPLKQGSMMDTAIRVSSQGSGPAQPSE